MLTYTPSPSRMVTTRPWRGQFGFQPGWPLHCRSFIVFETDEETADVDERYGINLDGGSRVKINGPLASGREVLNNRFTSDSKRMLYIADQNSDGSG